MQRIHDRRYPLDRPLLLNSFLAISLAMARDGSSGGCVRLVNITKDKEEREFVEYNKLPNKM